MMACQLRDVQGSDFAVLAAQPKPAGPRTPGGLPSARSSRTFWLSVDQLYSFCARPLAGLHQQHE